MLGIRGYLRDSYSIDVFMVNEGVCSHRISLSALVVYGLVLKCNGTSFIGGVSCAVCRNAYFTVNFPFFLSVANPV